MEIFSFSSRYLRVSYQVYKHVNASHYFVTFENFRLARGFSSGDSIMVNLGNLIPVSISESESERIPAGFLFELLFFIDPLLHHLACSPIYIGNLRRV